MTVEQIFGRKATQGTPKKKQEPEAKTKQLRFDGDGGAPDRALPDVKETEDEDSDSKGREAGERDVGAGAGGGASAGAGAPGAAPRTPASPSGGRSPLRRRDSAGSSGSKRRDSGPPLLRRQSTRDTINTAVTGVSAVSSRAGEALESLRSRRALAARNVAEDCYAGKLKKRYQRGETCVTAVAVTCCGAQHVRCGSRHQLLCVVLRQVHSQVRSELGHDAWEPAQGGRRPDGEEEEAWTTGRRGHGR